MPLWNGTSRCAKAGAAQRVASESASSERVMDMNGDPRRRKRQYRATTAPSQAAAGLVPREIWIRGCNGRIEFVMIPRVSKNHNPLGGKMRQRFMVSVVAALVLAACVPQAQDRPRIGGKPNINGIWQAMNSANWNLEGHAASQLKDFWRLGAVGAIPAG